LLWELEWGREIETLLAFQKESGITPKSLLDRPKLKDSYRRHLKAFYDLSSGRLRGEVPQPISQRDILDYADRLEGIDQVFELDWFFELMRSLDGAYLTKLTEQHARAK